MTVVAFVFDSMCCFREHDIDPRMTWPGRFRQQWLPSLPPGQVSGSYPFSFVRSVTLWHPSRGAVAVICSNHQAGEVLVLTLVVVGWFLGFDHAMILLFCWLLIWLLHVVLVLKYTVCEAEFPMVNNCLSSLCALPYFSLWMVMIRISNSVISACHSCGAWNDLCFCYKQLTCCWYSFLCWQIRNG